MKKLKKISLDVLKDNAEILSISEAKQCMGGYSTYYDEDGHPFNVYTNEEVAVMKVFGVWDGGYVDNSGSDTGATYQAYDCSIAPGLGMGSWWDSFNHVGSEQGLCTASALLGNNYSGYQNWLTQAFTTAGNTGDNTSLYNTFIDNAITVNEGMTEINLGSLINLIN